MVEEIDLVCPWVDGSDPAWQAERDRWKEDGLPDGSSLFRDWGLMRYWFRGVERALPWIRRVHFITWGHLPPWLNTEHPRLHVVRHEEFIPAAYLPTFSSNTIALNVHRIPGLAERFIYANDDTFFLSEVEPEAYFQQGLPCDCPHLLPITEICTDTFGYILWNNIACLNEHFSIRKCIEKNPEHWFHAGYPENVVADNRRAACLRHFPGFAQPHSPTSMLKSTYEEVWKKARGRLHAACQEKFRTWSDHTEWLMRYWQMASDNFVPYVRQGERFATVCGKKDALKRAILSTRTRMVCVNEGADPMDFVSRQAYLQELFERVFPEISSFERG